MQHRTEYQREKENRGAERRAKKNPHCKNRRRRHQQHVERDESCLHPPLRDDVMQGREQHRRRPVVILRPASRK